MAFEFTISALSFTEYLDGMKAKDEIYNQAYESIHNSLLNSL